MRRSAGSSSRSAYAASGSSGGRCVAQHVADRRQRELARRVVAAGERQLEVELVEAVRASQVAQAHAAEQRAERRLDRRAQPGDDHGRVADLDVSPRLRRRDLRTELGVEVGGREVRRLEHAVHERADVDADRHLAEQRRRRQRPGIGADRRRAAPGWRRGSSVDDRLLRLARDPGSYVPAVMSL